MGPSDLSRILAQLPPVTDPRVLVGRDLSDDGAVFRVRDDLAIVQSIDVFAPVVDDAYDYGRVAAANALSDIYAMGADPAFALAFVGFPLGDLPDDVLADILRGGEDVVRAAGASVIGGHSIRDAEPKYGLAVTGFVHPDRVLTNAAARPGDALVLTKPLGSGILAAAIRKGRLDPERTREVTELMVTLNRDASHAAVACGAHAATDVTGFGLLGHLLEMCRASGVSARLRASEVPHLAAAGELVHAGVLPGGTRRNLAHAERGGATRFDDAVDETSRLLLADAQTSGGLLVALPEDAARRMVAELEGSEAPCAVVVGTLEAHTDGAPFIHVAP